MSPVKKLALAGVVLTSLAFVSILWLFYSDVSFEVVQMVTRIAGSALAILSVLVIVLNYMRDDSEPTLSDIEELKMQLEIVELEKEIRQTLPADSAQTRSIQALEEELGKIQAELQQIKQKSTTRNTESKSA